MAEPRRAVRGADEQRSARSPQLHELLHEGQCTQHSPDRGAICCGVEAEGRGLRGIGAGVLDDQRVRQRRGAEQLGEVSERVLVGHRERDDDRRRVTGDFGSRVGNLGDLRTVGEVGPDQRVEDLGGDGVGRSRRAYAFTLDASLVLRCDVRESLSREMPMARSDARLDREIAESYLGRPVTGYTVASPLEPNRSRRVTGVAREIEARRGGLLLWVELPDGRRLPVAYEWIEAVVPRATARRR